jgi:aspartyl-tRNA(Asn)/glutamyl-tRNA(Gln) amidotransferase subunit C
MIEINEELIRKVAGLSKLELTEQETKKFTKDFSEIVSAFNVLEKADTAGVKSSFRPYEEKNNLREDVVRDCISQDEALKFTKNKDKGFFIGPRTIE